jgi:ribosomal protein S18 acetylase RimI-like enzyme
MSGPAVKPLEQHFFSEAPILGWGSWFWMRFWSGVPRKPSLVSLTDMTALKIVSNPRIHCSKALPSAASSYSTFLRVYFTEPRAQIILDVPATVLEAGLSSGALIGVEARAGQELIGFVVSSYGGKYLNTDVSMITWLCVHPQWRKRGVTNMLLRTMLKLTPQRGIHIWRNDGWLRSPIPPVFSDTRIQRRRQPMRSSIGSQTIHIQRASLARWRDLFARNWKKANPGGIFLDDQSYESNQVEVWVRAISKSATIAICLQPTYELNATTRERWCEVITWAVEGAELDDYSLALGIESILDRQSYDWIDASQMMPHLELGWFTGGSTSWSLLGLNPGSPVMRPMCSLCAC